MRINPDTPENRPNLEDAKNHIRERADSDAAAHRDREQQRDERRQEYHDWMRNGRHGVPARPER